MRPHRTTPGRCYEEECNVDYGVNCPHPRSTNLDPRIDQFVDERLAGLHDRDARHILQVSPGRYSWTGNDGYIYEQAFAVQVIEVTHLVGARVVARQRNPWP